MPPLLWLLVGCVEHVPWPDEGGVFPWVHLPETGLTPYELTRWETETWSLSDSDALALYLVKTQRHKPGAASDVLAHEAAMNVSIPPLVSGDLHLAFVGDAMWPGRDPRGYADAVADRLVADLVLGNLETPTDPGQPDHLDLPDLNAFNASPDLIDAAVDVWQVTNNHSLDVGDAGLEATVAEIVGRGRVAVGVDAPPMLEVNGVDVAVLAYTWGLNQRPHATSHDLHLVAFGHPGEVDLSSVRSDAGAARDAGAALVVIMVHWGWEYEYHADPHFLALGRELVRAGADVVVGSGPHVVQPAERCWVNPPDRLPGLGTCALRTPDGRARSAAIFYSLGDFVATPTLHAPQTRVGIIGHVTWTPEAGVTGLGWDPIATVDGAGSLVVVPAAGAGYDEEIGRLGTHLGAGWRVD